MGKLIIKPLHLNGAAVITTNPFEDHRGSFNRFFCSDELRELLGGEQIEAVNYSTTNQVGAIRGLHFQAAPFEEIKMVRCLKGKVFDVMVDVREDSPTYLQWHSEILTAEKENMMFIPKGFAHGFQVLEEKSELLYFHTAQYSHDSECALNYKDPKINIKWPLKVTDISSRDESHKYL